MNSIGSSATTKQENTGPHKHTQAGTTFYLIGLSISLFQYRPVTSAGLAAELHQDTAAVQLAEMFPYLNLLEFVLSAAIMLMSMLVHS